MLHRRRTLDPTTLTVTCNSHCTHTVLTLLACTFVLPYVFECPPCVCQHASSCTTVPIIPLLHSYYTNCTRTTGWSNIHHSMVDDLGLTTKERVKRGLLRKFRQVSKKAALAKRQALANGSLLLNEIGGNQMSLAEVVKRAVRVRRRDMC